MTASRSDTGAPPEPWTLDAGEVVAALASDAARGLGAEAGEQLQRHGSNELRARARKPAWQLFAEQFTRLHPAVRPPPAHHELARD